jgi:peptidoglycan/LPS O-acetylase OafA/YrhL/lysophospholipase L1-like esterase
MSGETRMGYQPALDGLRALSVLAVILYHAGIHWIPGGFIGVEVFFVVSGFLITSLMIDEQHVSGKVSLKQFWVRRARRLLPALFTMLIASLVAVTFFVKDSAPDFRQDVLPALGYFSNWWQIYFVDTPYFAANSLPMLRHLWSLAVEEQWYVLWPIAFGFVLGNKRIPRWISAVVIGLLAAGAMVGTALAFTADDETRINFLYLSTITRSSGLLLGAALACVWHPWKKAVVRFAKVRSGFADVLALGALATLGYISAVIHVADEQLYKGGLAAATIASAVIIAVVVRSGKSLVKRALSFPLLVEIGRRSYGLYLWHWPIFVVTGARLSSIRLASALTATVIINEFVYQFIETPARKGAIGNWLRQRRQLSAMRRRLPVALTVVVAALVGVTSVQLSGIQARDVSVDTGNTDVVFVVPTTLPTTATTAVNTPVTSTTLAKLPRRVVIVGDSQAHSLAVNKPSGIENTFVITNGSIDGCGVYDRGVGIGGTSGKFRRNFANCKGFETKWARSAAQAKADVALVVLGAWEVMDLQINSFLFKVNTVPADTIFKTQLQRGIDALRKQNVAVALLEVACMRPVESKGGPVPPLPQRGDDTRTGHLNTLMREVAAPENDGVYFVNGPKEWCNDSKIANSLSYRWDGVHVYKPGAKLILETIAPVLLQIPVTRSK